jgi:hypothetical protein
VAST